MESGMIAIIINSAVHSIPYCLLLAGCAIYLTKGMHVDGVLLLSGTFLFLLSLIIGLIFNLLLIYHSNEGKSLIIMSYVSQAIYLVGGLIFSFGFILMVSKKKD